MGARGTSMPHTSNANTTGNAQITLNNVVHSNNNFGLNVNNAGKYEKWNRVSQSYSTYILTYLLSLRLNSVHTRLASKRPMMR